jgi:hypothetical protein
MQILRFAQNDRLSGLRSEGPPQFVAASELKELQGSLLALGSSGFRASRVFTPTV